jgi:hypothetical protein
MIESQQDRDSLNLGRGSKSASPSNYWGCGNFASRKVATLPESQVATSSGDQEGIPSRTALESKLS